MKLKTLQVLGEAKGVCSRAGYEAQAGRRLSQTVRRRALFFKNRMSVRICALEAITRTAAYGAALWRDRPEKMPPPEALQVLSNG